MNQGGNFNKLQDFLNNYVLKNFIKVEEMVEIITDMNNADANFDKKHIPDDLTEKEEESKIKMKIW